MVVRVNVGAERPGPDSHRADTNGGEGEAGRNRGLRRARSGTVKPARPPTSGMSGRPLDVLEASVGDDVTVRLKGGEVYDGVLAGYDQHMNLVLEDVEEANAPDPGADHEDSTPEEDRENPTPEERGGVTIIRGDNLVSLSI